MSTAVQGIDPTTRKVPPMGGFNLVLVGIELRRMLRNRRTIIFALIFPAALFFVFGSGDQGAEKLRRRRGARAATSRRT